MARYCTQPPAEPAGPRPCHPVFVFDSNRHNATAVTPPPGRFLGTESFPEEGAFKAFLQKHGGSSNAFTGMETTGFHFVLQERALRPALKHFSSFFTVSSE